MTALFLNPSSIDEAVRRALDEDLGRAGDITSVATIPAHSRAGAVISARTQGVIAGLPLAAAAFRLIDFGLGFSAEVSDGTPVEPGAMVARIGGSACSLLAGERVALNFLGRLSGIATLTAAYVAKTSGTRARIVCTEDYAGLTRFRKIRGEMRRAVRQPPLWAG
jgi:nicotinate-nucleotide pyrophosphorylase (carboxylating)